MNLPADTAAILRDALNEAEHLSGFDDRKAFMVLAEAVGNLLTPLPIEPNQGQPEGLFDDYLKSGDEADLPF